MKDIQQIKEICRFSGKCRIIMLSLTFICLALVAITTIPKISFFIIRSQDYSFNLETEILSKYLEIFPGEEVWFTIELMNLGNQNREDVILTYKITDLNQNQITSKTETLAVETQNSFVRNLEIPKDTAPGNYILYNEAVYADGTKGIAEHRFRVIENKKKFNWTLIIYLIVIAIILIIMARLIYIVSKLKNAVKKLTKK